MRERVVLVELRIELDDLTRLLDRADAGGDLDDHALAGRVLVLGQCCQSIGIEAHVGIGPELGADPMVQLRLDAAHHRLDRLLDEPDARFDVLRAREPSVAGGRRDAHHARIDARRGANIFARDPAQIGKLQLRQVERERLHIRDTAHEEKSATPAARDHLLIERGFRGLRLFQRRLLIYDRVADRLAVVRHDLPHELRGFVVADDVVQGRGHARKPEDQPLHAQVADVHDVLDGRRVRIAQGVQPDVPERVALVVDVDGRDVLGMDQPKRDRERIVRIDRIARGAGQATAQLRRDWPLEERERIAIPDVVHHQERPIPLRAHEAVRRVDELLQRMFGGQHLDRVREAAGVVRGPLLVDLEGNRTGDVDDGPNAALHHRMPLPAADTDGRAGTLIVRRRLAAERDGAGRAHHLVAQATLRHASVPANHALLRIGGATRERHPRRS